MRHLLMFGSSVSFHRQVDPLNSCEFAVSDAEMLPEAVCGCACVLAK